MTGHRQRLKDRFIAAEPRALEDGALLELLLTYAIPQKDVRPLAERLIAAFGSLRAVVAADDASLRATDGVGEHASVLLRLVGRIAAPPPAASDAAPVPDRPGVEAGPRRAAPLPAAPAPGGDGEMPLPDTVGRSRSARAGGSFFRGGDHAVFGTRRIRQANGTATAAVTPIRVKALT